MEKALRLLLVEDSELDEQLLIRELRRQGYAPTWRRVDTAGAMAEALSRFGWDLVISDYTMPSFSGLEALRVLQQSGIDLPIICVSGTVGEDTAVAVMKAGANDYIMKENLRRLGPAIDRELRDADVRRERRRAEQAERRMIEELRRSNEELARFAHVASHDLQEPLRMVLNYTQLLAKRFKEAIPHDPDVDEFIGYAIEGAQRMHGLINDLLDLSSVNARPEQFTQVSCERTVRHAMENLRLAIAGSGAQITHDALPTVIGNETQITQLFQNLLGNAVKFRSQEPPRIRIAVERQDETALFSVIDNGIGIDPKYAEKVFVIFQRLHRREDYPGTGTGLAVCKKIVEWHGGRIWVESEPGLGSTFRFVLPVSVPLRSETDASTPATTSSVTPRGARW